MYGFFQRLSKCSKFSFLLQRRTQANRNFVMCSEAILCRPSGALFSDLFPEAGWPV
jgi:hypothetical protein